MDANEQANTGLPDPRLDQLTDVFIKETCGRISGKRLVLLLRLLFARQQPALGKADGSYSLSS
jgi:hypothetical protein